MDLTRRRLLTTGIAAAAAAVPQARSANDRIQVGVVGCGARSHELMRHLLANPGVAITGVVDAYKGRVERALDRVGPAARSYRDYKEVLADKSIDAVVIATPDHWHKTMVMDAISAGKDVYCEKPLTYRASEGKEIIDAAARTGRIVQVGSQPVSSNTQQKAREIIQSGKIGKVTLVRAAYNRNTASGAWIYPIPPDASPSTVNWDMFLGPAPKRPFSLERFFRWRCYKDYSGGISTDLFVHLCTTIHFLMNARMPSRVVAMGQLYRWKDREVPDTINAVLEYPEGFAVNLSSTFNNQMSGEGAFQFLGTEGSVTLGGGLDVHPEDAVEDNRWIVESWAKSMEEAYFRNPKVRANEAPHARKPKGQVQHFKSEGPDSTVTHFAGWLNSIRTRQQPWENATVGHRAAACAHMVNKSAAEGKLVEWDFSADDIKG
ncbi:MAG: Gfo/Idh/MocA family oxidoreductase [Acidobacteria bacterium]|nr:Gfo/Idh/MocA family oxidoreductase [Acidobacteriota bacterium]